VREETGSDFHFWFPVLHRARSGQLWHTDWGKQAGLLDTFC